MPSAISPRARPLFAEVDEYPTRRAAPEGPLMLVDRVLAIEGEPKSMASGRVITDHTVRATLVLTMALPTSITVESGQATSSSRAPRIDFTRRAGRLPVARCGRDVPPRAAAGRRAHRIRHPIDGSSAGRLVALPLPCSREHRREAAAEHDRCVAGFFTNRRSPPVVHRSHEARPPTMPGKKPPIGRNSCRSSPARSRRNRCRPPPGRLATAFGERRAQLGRRTSRGDSHPRHAIDSASFGAIGSSDVRPLAEGRGQSPRGGCTCSAESEPGSNGTSSVQSVGFFPASVEVELRVNDATTGGERRIVKTREPFGHAQQRLPSMVPSNGSGRATESAWRRSRRSGCRIRCARRPAAARGGTSRPHRATGRRPSPRVKSMRGSPRGRGRPAPIRR